MKTRERHRRHVHVFLFASRHRNVEAKGYAREERESGTWHPIALPPGGRDDQAKKRPQQQAWRAGQGRAGCMTSVKAGVLQQLAKWAEYISMGCAE